jgi:hypothetical protein
MSQTSAPFESHSGALAVRDPAEPPDRLAEERKEEQINAPKLAAYLNKTLDAIAGLDANENLKIHNEMVKCVAYYDGRWDGECRNGEWVDNESVAGEVQPSDNEYKKQIDKLQMEMCRGRIEYKPEAVNRFSAEMREAAQFAERRIAVNQDRIETEPFIQGENMSLLLKKWALRYTFFDQNADSSEQCVEMRVMKHVTAGRKVQVCRTCGLTKTDPVCPNCGDTEAKDLAYPDSEGIKTEQNTKSAGRVVTVRPDATMVQLDLNGRDIASSLFVRWRVVLRRCDWESMFPNVKIPSSDESKEARDRSDAQSQPSQSGWGGSSDYSAGGDQFEKIEGELVWLDPKVYQRYVNPENETLGEGRELKKGEKFVDPYPSGACIARIGKKILDVFASNKNECWTMCVYGLREHALHGSGTVALLGPQDTINDENAFIVAHHYYAAAGREFVRSGALEGGKLPAYNQVGIVEAPPEVNDIVGYAYGRSQPESLASDVYGFRDAMRASLQDAAGTSSLSMQGAADTKALGTATGVEASRDQAVGRMIPNRKLQAFAGTEWIKQVLCFEREHYTAEMFLEMAGKCDEKGEVEYTERGVRAFFNCNVKTDLIIKPVEGSWMPTTPQQKRANAASFAQAAGQLKESPELVSLIASDFDIDHSVDEWGAAQRNASMRIEEYARVSGIIAQGGFAASPEMVDVVLANVAEWARVNPYMDDHPAFRDFYQDWWLSDEGRNADSLLRLVVQTVHGLHLNKGIVTQAQEQGAAQIASQSPQMAMQEQMANQQKEQQATEMAQADEQGTAELIQNALGEQALKEKDREHQAQTQAELDAEKTQNQAELESHKALLNAAASPVPQAVPPPASA